MVMNFSSLEGLEWLQRLQWARLQRCIIVIRSAFLHWQFTQGTLGRYLTLSLHSVSLMRALMCMTML